MCAITIKVIQMFQLFFILSIKPQQGVYYYSTGPQPTCSEAWSTIFIVYQWSRNAHNLLLLEYDYLFKILTHNLKTDEF